MPISADISMELIHHLTAQPPAIIESFAASGSADNPWGTPAKRAAWLAEKERAVDAWIETGRARRETIWHLAGANPWTLEDAELVDQIIMDLDANAQAFANDLKLAERRIQLALREKRGQLDKQSLRKFEENLTEHFPIAAKEIDEKIGIVLFFKALRAEFAPIKQEGRTFDSVFALRDFLRSL